MHQFTELPPLGLYIHFPWCVRKCPYCDFNSHEAQEDIPEQAYIDSLLEDLDWQLPWVWGRSIQSIFMGGGTPSLFSAESLDRLISGLRARLNFPPDTEITLEANPGTVEQAKFRDFRALGINRLSVGVQSFEDSQLQKLGRIHDSKEATRAIEAAHAAGFERLNIDLMYGLPGQSEKDALDDLKTALSLEAGHISHYQLTIEPNTWFRHHPPTLPDDDLVARFETSCRELLNMNGFSRYEISAFARIGQECRHNINYWEFGDYLGIGAGAHGKITDVPGQKIRRSLKPRNPRSYLSKPTETQQRIPGKKETAFEFFLNCFRLIGGFETGLFQSRCGLPISYVEKPLRMAEDKGLIEWDLKHIRPSETGLQFLNDLTVLFLPDDTKQSTRKEVTGSGS